MRGLGRLFQTQRLHGAALIPLFQRQFHHVGQITLILRNVGSLFDARLEIQPRRLLGFLGRTCRLLCGQFLCRTHDNFVGRAGEVAPLSNLLPDGVGRCRRELAIGQFGQFGHGRRLSGHQLPGGQHLAVAAGGGKRRQRLDRAWMQDGDILGAHVGRLSGLVADGDLLGADLGHNGRALLVEHQRVLARGKGIGCHKFLHFTELYGRQCG